VCLPDKENSTPNSVGTGQLHIDTRVGRGHGHIVIQAHEVVEGGGVHVQPGQHNTTQHNTITITQNQEYCTRRHVVLLLHKNNFATLLHNHTTSTSLTPLTNSLKHSSNKQSHKITHSLTHSLTHTAIPVGVGKLLGRKSTNVQQNTGHYCTALLCIWKESYKSCISK
jgi:hypothetical protein